MRAHSREVHAVLRMSVSPRIRAAALVVAAMVLGACGGILDVSNPTLVRDTDIANAAGANARRLNVVHVLNTNAPSLAEDVALFTDEWVQDQPLQGRTRSTTYLDQRNSEQYEQSMQTTDRHVGLWDQVYWQTSMAIPAVRAYTPDSLRGDFLGQLYAIRGYAVLQLAEDICPGFPVNDVAADNQPLFSRPFTTDSAFALASAQLDSAVKYVQDTARFITLARVTKGRALLDQGQYAAAAAVVAPVQTSWTYEADGSLNAMGRDMNVGRWSRGGYNYAIGDREGGNGLPFVSAHDPRIPTVLGGVRASFSSDTLYKTTKYTTTSHMILASGVEARLIEAEAALHAGDPSWLTILNDLRAAVNDPALPALTDPGTDSARVDLVYYERAFWLFATGRRLGDLRRLVRNYGRDPETVFPTGSFIVGGQYAGATAIPFILAGQQQSNPNITTGCTTR